MAGRKPRLLAGEPKENESSNAIQAFNDYARLGPARSMRKLVRKYGKTRKNTAPTTSNNTLEKWSAEFDWQERVAEYDAAIEDARNEKHRKEMEAGLALEYERVRKLKRLAAMLEQQILDQIDPSYFRHDEGEVERPVYRPAPGMENYKLWLRDVKQVGGGEFATTVDVYRYNSALVSDLRGVLDDLAKETGGRKQRSEHTIKNLDYSKLTDDQIDRIAAGEDPVKVILSDFSGTGAG